jgi:DNA-binding CsgD family transcriptional regulator
MRPFATALRETFVRRIRELRCRNLVISGRPMSLDPSTRNWMHAFGSERAILVVSSKGRLLFMTSRAANWLKGFSSSRPNRQRDSLQSWLKKIVSSGRPARFILERAGIQLCFQVICRDANSVGVLLEQRVESSVSNDVRGRLTRRQVEVLSWVARGKTNAEIAKILGLEPKTIGKHLERIFPKLGVENRTAAASFVLGTNHAI